MLDGPKIKRNFEMNSFEIYLGLEREIINRNFVSFLYDSKSFITFSQSLLEYADGFMTGR